MTTFTTAAGAIATLLRRSHWLVACCMLAGNALAAQQVGIPAACAGKSGKELDNCMLNVTKPQFLYGVTPVERQPPKPSPVVFCANVLPADQTFCGLRNEVIIYCQKNARKQGDFQKCLGPAMERLPVKLAPANCSKVKSKVLATQCPIRNKHYKTCAADPYNYFTCLDEKYAKK